jgi:hypothetical protein
MYLAVHMSRIGPSRHFAAVQYFGSQKRTLDGADAGRLSGE